MFSSNRWEVSDQLETKIMTGITIIIDRYAYSGVAYTAAKGLDLEWCKLYDNGLPKPDLIFFMNANNSEDLAKREGYGDERYEEVSFQSKVYDKFIEVFRSCDTTLVTWVTPDSSQPDVKIPDINSVHKTVVRNVNSIMKSCRNKPIRYLW
jgi:dTMP kinase